jgi:hypothetical protein
VSPVAHLHVVRDETTVGARRPDTDEGSTHDDNTERDSGVADARDLRVRAAHPSGSGRPTPYQSGLAAVARPDW